MSDVGIERRKEQLLQMKSELLELQEMARETAESVQLDQARIGRLSRMDAMQSQQMALEADRRRERQLVAIEGALRRIESGDYGICFICGDEISANRLAINPANTRCMECVEK